MSLILQYTPYSVSKIKSFISCPYKFKLQYIDKLKPEIVNSALIKGTLFHSMVEKYMKNEVVQFPENEHLSKKDILSLCEAFYNFCLKFNFLKEKELKGIEEKFALKIENKKIYITDYNDKNAFIRGAIDFYHKENNTLYIFDWKTGKQPTEIDILQLIVYSLWAFEKFEDIDKTIVSFVYVEEDKTHTETFYRNDRISMFKELFSLVKQIEKEKHFFKNETHLCNYCSYRIEGICKQETQEEFLQKINKYQISLPKI